MLIKNSLKKIKKSFGRYLSLVLIIFIGVGFYTGIIESIPNIKRVQTEFYNEKNAMDIKVLSTLGFNKEDIKALKEVEDGKCEPFKNFCKEMEEKYDIH